VRAQRINADAFHPFYRHPRRLSWIRMFLLDCPEAPAARELKSKDRIEGSTFSSIKLRFRMAKFETILGVVHHPGPDPTP
jgi:hypothetical protein